MRLGFIKLALMLALCGPLTAQQINLQTQVKGLLPPANGGSGVDTSGMFGCPKVTAGVWSFTSANCSSGGAAPAGGNYAIQYANGSALGGANFTGFTFNNGGSQPPTQATQSQLNTLIGSAANLPYPTATVNQVWQYSGANTVGPGGFLARLDLAGCSTAYLYDEGTGTTLNNRCATGATRNGVTVGSPTWSQYGLILNAGYTPATGMAVQLPATENTARTFLIGGYFPTFGTHEGVNWTPGITAGNFPQNGSLLCATANNLICTSNSNWYGETAAIADSLHFLTPAKTAGTETVAAQSIPTGNHVVVLVCGNGSDGDQIYVDGSPLPMARSNNSCPTNTATGQYQIGGSALLTNTYKSILVGITATWQARLTPTQIAAQSYAALGYLTSRGQVVAPSPSAAVGSVPSVSCIGDSRTYGVSSIPGICTVLTLDNTSAVKQTYALPGLKAYDMCSDPEGVFQATPKLSSNVVDILWIDINDAVFNTSAVLTNSVAMLAYDRCIVKNLKATGATVLIATEISADSTLTSDGDQVKNSVNAAILANTWGADGVVALGSFPVLGADGASANATYFNTLLHPTTLSQTTIIGPAYSNAINELWGSTANNYNEITSTTYQELAKDGFLRMNAASAATVTLPDCQGYTKPRTIYNASAFTVTVNPAASGFYASFSETIDGGSSTTIPAGTTKVFGIIQGPPSAGTCDWQTL